MDCSSSCSYPSYKKLKSARRRYALSIPPSKNPSVIESANRESPQTVGSHYDDLDSFYRETWGTHVHHGFWKTGKETVAEATLQLLSELLADVPIVSGTRICDVGCGYGESSRHLARSYGAPVTGYTVSKAQCDYAVLNSKGLPAQFILGNWLENRQPSDSFDLLIAIESTEHMPDLRKFFQEAYRVLRPGGRIKICAWLGTENPSSIEERFLLRPICTEGRLRLGAVSEYLSLMTETGFQNPAFKNVTEQVKRTWTLCTARVFKRLLTDSRYIRFLTSDPSKNKSFLKSLVRIRVAYEIQSMLYGFIDATKPSRASSAGALNQERS